MLRTNSGAPPCHSLLEKLPVELLYEIQLSALSDAFPILNKRLHAIFSSTHATYRAEYLFRRYRTRSSASWTDTYTYTQGQVVSYALQHRMCREDVLDAVLRLVANETEAVQQGPAPVIPKRLFKTLAPRTAPARYTPSDAPLPILRHLYAHARSSKHIHPPDANAHEGYALARAVHAGHRPLIKFLLGKGAKPGLKDALAVRIAIRKGELALVRGLVEREAEEEGACVDESAEMNECDAGAGVGQAVKKRKKTVKRRRVEDRVEVTTAMLRLAVEADARDIVQYFLDKGARPDMSTIQRMRRSGFV